MALYVGHMNYKVKILVKIYTFIDSGQTKITNGVTLEWTLIIILKSIHAKNHVPGSFCLTTINE